ncbi:MAG TPA: hypothetical protein VHA82_01870 [Ramlibacter sp.]|uniref:hypothetical protein n=1 Tax=Ramlibacter sp. TaxID=1917967 RepID=UPI002C32CB13|nr:hypothetical protein [Ramlibacter sp.]HVZ42527.1 hypothetical protein [Ramlibacter sp.]
MDKAARDHLFAQNRQFVADVPDDLQFRTYLSDAASGITLIPEPMGPNIPAGLHADFGDFLKWSRQNSPGVQAKVSEQAPRVALHSAEVWLPLVAIASDTSVQVFLNMAANYLYDRARGSLKGDKVRIRLRAVYTDKQQGRTKRFEFEGDADSLRKVATRFDMNNFFDDRAGN